MSIRDRVKGEEKLLPQLELGPRLGGAKVLLQRSSFLMQGITMVSAMGSFWATSPSLRAFFDGSVVLFYGATALLVATWVTIYYSVILPSEQTFNQTQSQRAERSPLKRDTEEIIDRLEALENDA